MSDILLLGNEQQVRLAEKAARDLVAGRPIHTQELVVSLRDFIREALDLDPLPAGLAIPPQGPTRSVQTGGKGKSDQDKGGGAGEKGSGGQMGMGMVGLGGGAIVGIGAEQEEGDKTA